MAMIASIFRSITDLGIEHANTTGLSYIVGMNNTEFILSIYFIIILMITDYFIRDRGIEDASSAMSIPVRWAFSWFLLTNLTLLAPSDTGAFIYFQF